MIVINKKPNITHMPYALDGRKGKFSFAPGRNTIDANVWRAVLKEAGEKRFSAHYGKFLKPIGEDAPEEKIDPSTLNAHDAIDLVNGTMTVELLDQYTAAENDRKSGPRKMVLEAIERQLAENRQDRKQKDRLDGRHNPKRSAFHRTRAGVGVSVRLGHRAGRCRPNRWAATGVASRRWDSATWPPTA